MRPMLAPGRGASCRLSSSRDVQDAARVGDQHVIASLAVLPRLLSLKAQWASLQRLLSCTVRRPPTSILDAIRVLRTLTRWARMTPG
jgi:hypothetical protein